MNKRYPYYIYLKHCIWKPVQERYYYKELRNWISLSDFIRRPLNRVYFYKNYYLDWCYINWYIPKVLTTYSYLGDRIYDTYHNQYTEAAIDSVDKVYLKSIERKEVDRKSYINQNMILFYKNYFKRKW